MSNQQKNSPTHTEELDTKSVKRSVLTKLLQRACAMEGSWEDKLNTADVLGELGENAAICELLLTEENMRVLEAIITMAAMPEHELSLRIGLQLLTALVKEHSQNAGEKRIINISTLENEGEDEEENLVVKENVEGGTSETSALLLNTIKVSLPVIMQVLEPSDADTIDTTYGKTVRKFGMLRLKAVTLLRHVFAKFTGQLVSEIIELRVFEKLLTNAIGKPRVALISLLRGL